MEAKKASSLRRFFAIRGMSAAMISFAALIVIYIGFGIMNPVMFSGDNIMNLLRAMSKYLLIGIGQSYILITGNIDLSLGAVVGMSAMMAGTLMTHGVNPVVACLFVGVINGFLVGQLKLPPFIATLGTMFAARGVAYMVNGNRNTDAISSGIGKEAADTFQNIFYYGKTFGIYNTFLIAMVIFAAFFFLLSRTRTGRHIYAVGSNVDAAKLSGVSVFGTTTKTYLVSAFCAFVTGLILCAQAGMGNMEAGNTYEMYAVAASVIGGVSPLGGTGLLLGTLGGAAVWQTLENGLDMVHAPVGIQRLAMDFMAPNTKDDAQQIESVNNATASTVSRDEGFRAAFEGTGYTLLETQFCEGDAAKAQSIAENFITEGVVGIYGCNEGSTTGAGNAIKASGKSIVGVGFDKSDAIMGLINDGYLLATMAQNLDVMGYEGVKAAVAALKGESLGGKVTDTGVSVLTK